MAEKILIKSPNELPGQFYIFEDESETIVLYSTEDLSELRDMYLDLTDRSCSGFIKYLKKYDVEYSLIDTDYYRFN